MSMSSLPENVQNAFKEVFAQLPQRVLWKYEGEMKDKPENVMTMNWFPQRDVLCKTLKHSLYSRCITRNYNKRI
jgi:glucuronosyltransferase